MTARSSPAATSWVGSYLLNADVRAGGRLAVRSGGETRGGSIVVGRVFRILGLHEINAAHMKTLIAQAPPEQRERVMKVLKHLQSLTSTNQTSLKMRAELESQGQQSIKNGEIRILGTALTDAEIRMGEQKLILSEDLEHHAFRLTSHRVVKPRRMNRRRRRGRSSPDPVLRADAPAVRCAAAPPPPHSDAWARETPFPRI